MVDGRIHTGCLRLCIVASQNKTVIEEQNKIKPFDKKGSKTHS